MNMIEIERALRELRLSGIAETLSTRVMQAQAAQQPFLETFASMLQDELDRRRSRLTERRFKRSGLDERLSLVDFDWRFNPKLPRSACFELHTLKFIGEGANALIIGKPGTGKSHVAKAVAYQATLQGYDARYLEADTEFARYALASDSERTELLKDWVTPDLIILDDLFLARRISEHAAEVLQAIVHQRYKLRRSIVITSNRVIQDWGATWATRPWPPPSSIASCTAAPCWSSRARATASRRPPHASPSHPSRHNPAVLPGGIWGGQGWGNLTWPSGYI